MTCIISIQEASRYRKSFEEYVEISKNASDIDGTRAGLVYGDSLRI